MTDTPTAPDTTDTTTDPNYLDLVEAMTTTNRPTWRHTVCLNPALHTAVDEAQRRLGRAIIDKAAAETKGTATRQKLGHVSPVTAAERDLDAAKAERDRNSVVFVLSPPTADEEAVIIDRQPAAATGRLYEYQMQRITLLAAWRHTETTAGQPLPSLDRDQYGKVLAAAGRTEIARAWQELQRVATQPDFN